MSVNYIQLDSEDTEKKNENVLRWRPSEIVTILQMIRKLNSIIAESSMLLNKQKKGRRRRKTAEGG